MAEYLTNTEDMSIVANAIRAKGGTSAPLEFPQGMAQAITDIPTGGGGVEVNEVEDLILGKLVSFSSKKIKRLTPAFTDSAGIKSLDLPECTSMSNSALVNSSVESMYTPKVDTLGYRCCDGSKLKVVDFPAYDNRIDTSTFERCSKLEKADFARVSSIGQFSFATCGALKTLIIRNAITICSLINTNAFAESTLMLSGLGYVYVPRALVDQYKAATNWVQFADQIRAIEDYPEITGG